jgi:hypothetical protein
MLSLKLRHYHQPGSDFRLILLQRCELLLGVHVVDRPPVSGHMLNLTTPRLNNFYFQILHYLHYFCLAPYLDLGLYIHALVLAHLEMNLFHDHDLNF